MVFGLKREFDMSQSRKRLSLNLRIRPEERGLIDRAAKALGKNRTDFMLDAARRAAQEALLDRTIFTVSPKVYAEFLARWRSIPAQITVPGGERLGDVAERAWNALTQIVRRHQEAERILVVSHNFPILGIICRVTGTHLNDYRTFHLDPCSLTRLRYDGNGDWQVTQVNNREYPFPMPTSL